MITNPSKHLIKVLKRRYPHQVKVKKYLSKMRRNRLPKRDKIWDGKAASWVVHFYEQKWPKLCDNTTVFGFTTAEEMERFKEEYSL